MAEENWHIPLADIDFKLDPSQLVENDTIDLSNINPNLATAQDYNLWVRGLTGGSAALYTRFEQFVDSRSINRRWAVGLPHEFEDFVASFEDYEDEALGVVPLASGSVLPGAQGLWAQIFRNVVGIQTDDFRDIDHLAAFGNADPLVNNYTLLQGAWRKFATEFNAPPDMTAQDLMRAWNKFLTTTAVLASIDPGDTAIHQAWLSNPGTFATYIDLYKGFSQDIAAAGFSAKISAFIADRVQKTGYFLPGHHIDEWVQVLQKDLKDKLRIELTPDENVRRSIMIKVFEILRTILERLQDTVQTQALRLKFLTEVQREYTTLMNRVPIYTEGATKYVGTVAIDSNEDGILNSPNDGMIHEFVERRLYGGVGSERFDELNPANPFDFNRAYGGPANTYNGISTPARANSSSGNIWGNGFGARFETGVFTEADGNFVTEIGGKNYIRSELGPLPAKMGGWDLAPGFFIPQGHFNVPAYTADWDMRRDTRQSLIQGVRGPDTTIFNEQWLDQKGFAGITLREIFNDVNVRPSYSVYAPGELELHDSYRAGLNTPTIAGRAEIAGSHPFTYMHGQRYPGVWWFAEQPYDGSAKWGRPADEQAELRNNEINPRRNKWIEQIRSLRGIFKDEAKQAQTNLSGSREAVSQQANLMTSILQQLSTVLQSIFR